MDYDSEPRVVLEALRTAFLRWLRHEKDRRENRCIFFTRAAIEVCGEFGVVVEPLSVTLEVFNAIMARQIQEGRSPQIASGMWFAPAFDPGAWGVGVDPSKPMSGPGWNGHLVAHVEGKQSFILDLSQGQFSRPEYDMNYGPALLEIEPGAPPPWNWTLPSGDLLIITPCPQNKDWVTKPAWKLSPAGRRAIKQLVNETRLELRRTRSGDSK